MDKKLTIVEERYIAGDVRYIEGFCETGADLPTDNIATGSNIYNIDEGVAYFFKASTGEWVAAEDEEGE